MLPHLFVILHILFTIFAFYQYFAICQYFLCILHKKRTEGARVMGQEVTGALGREIVVSSLLVEIA
jgi:hypothetical protein